MKRSTVVLVGLVLLIFTFQANAESPFIYGIHDHDTNPQEYLDHIRNGGATGWVTATVAIGSNPNDQGGADFSNLSNQGHTVIVRLNNGYGTDGTIPVPAKYADFAKRAANFVAASQGANIWIIGNETNLAGEWPLINGRLQYVSPQDYANCFRLAYNAIKQVRPDAKVLPQALAPFAGPYNAGSTNGYPHDALPLNWVQYLNQMLTAIKSSGGIDGIALHINSRGYTYNDIHSTRKVNAGGQDLYFSFYVYKDWVDLGIPSDLYHLPLYATESNGIYYWSGGHPERPDSHYEAGWMQEVYAEINRYNQLAAATGKPVFRCVNMYRWCAWCDGWNIDGSPYKGQILADLDQAVAAGYRWPDGDVEPPPPPPVDQPAGDNLALEAAGWSASSSYNADFGGNKAYDGLIAAGSKWTSNGSGAESWLAFDLGSVKEITGFIVRHAGDAGEPDQYNTVSYRIESGSSLAGPWTGLDTVFNSSQADATTTVLADRVNARYVRLYITDAGIDNYARIPEFEVYGFDVTTPPPPAGALVNGGFEGGVGGNGVGQGWTAFASAGYGADLEIVSDPVYSGGNAQEILAHQPPTGDKFAGIYQVVATTPGAGYVIRAWNQTYFPGGNSWDHIARLGIDLTGGTDFQSGSVTWYEFDSAKQIWHQLEITATATGTTMTVYLQSWRKWASGGDARAWFDDVQVTADDVNPPDNQNPTAVIAATPTRGTAPLAVALNGGGSFDSDGDDLSYEWDFGDGAQASGASVNHTYQSVGTYTAALTVADGRGGSHSATVVITVTDVDPPPGSTIVNGGFEGAAAGNGVGEGWTAFSSGGYGPGWQVAGDAVHGGSNAQKVTAPQPAASDKFAGIYQVVATHPGTGYVIRAWNQTYFPGGNSWDHIARLGIDLTGGTDFQSGSVTWYEFDSAKQIWHQLEINATATGPAMTVFLQSWRKWASGGDAWALFDDVQVATDGVDPPGNQNPTAVISAAPTSGLAPLAVAFNGSGSSDPDGDNLSYAWDFGDGAQASVVSVNHSYQALGTYTAALTVSDGKGGSHTTTVVITVTDDDPQPGNKAPQAVFTASPRTGKAPLTVAFDAGGSSDPDGDSLIFSWQFGDGSQGSGSTVTHTFQNIGSYSTILTVSDGRGGSDTSSMVISVTSSDIPMPWGCPSALNFDEIRAQLNQQGQDLAHVKIGFHVAPAGNANGLGDWMRCLDAAGVPFFLKSADSAGQIWEAAQLKAASGVPHVLVYRRSFGDGWQTDVPDYNGNAYDVAVEHWQRQRNEFPPELEQYKHLIWVETINEVDKNRSEWLAEFAYHTALIAMEQGFNWAAFGWSSGEPEREHWEGPWMQKFLKLAGQYPDRVGVALHEYSYVQENLDRFYPNLVGRFQTLYEVCDDNGIPRPTVVITEFGWVYDNSAKSVGQAMNVDLPWAAELYAPYPQVLGAAIWYLGSGFGDVDDETQKLIAPMTEYAMQNYFVIPQESSTPNVDTTPADGDATIGEVGWINDTLDHSPQTIYFQHSYRNPVVFAQAPSQDGGDTSVVRITDVQPDHFSLYLQEAPNKDGWHTPEAVSYLVLEAGSWALGDGTHLEVGTVATGATVGHGIDNLWQPINFAGPFAGAPVIFSQVQGAGDPHWVKTRQRNAGSAGFEVAMEEEENKASAHGLETIGWMAIEAGTGVWSGHPYEAALTPDTVTHAWYTLNFGQNFVEVPRLITSLATFDGADSSHLRYNRTSLSAEGVDIRVEEDTAGDTETDHTTERVGFLAIEQNGLLTASEIGVAMVPAGVLLEKVLPAVK